MFLSSDSEATVLCVVRIQVTTQVFLLALVTPILRTVRFAITAMPGINTEPVPAPPARNTVTVGIVEGAFTIERSRTVLLLAFFVLFPLIFSETLPVTGAVVNSPVSPGLTAGIVVKVVVVTAVVWRLDSFIVSLGTVVLPVTNIAVFDPLDIASTDPIYSNTSTVIRVTKSSWG